MANTPVVSARSGNLSLALWENTSVRDDLPEMYYTVTIKKSYEFKGDYRDDVVSLHVRALPEIVDMLFQLVRSDEIDTKSMRDADREALEEVFDRLSPSKATKAVK